MLSEIILPLIMVLIVAIFLFLICETTISFVFYFTGFLLVLTLINLWYITRNTYRPRREPYIVGGETLISKRERDEQTMF